MEKATEMTIVDDMYRDELIESRCEHNFGVFQLDSEIQRMEFYLKNLEQFIEEEENKEVTLLKVKTKGLSKAEKSEFWAWNYPIHWEEIFQSRLRSSFLISLISLLELHLTLMCNDISIITYASIKHSDLRGSILDRSRKYLEEFGGFSKGLEGDWGMINFIYTIRNAFVHNNGFLKQGNSQSKKINKFKNNFSGIKTKDISIEMNKKFCFECLDTVCKFLKKLRIQMHLLCERSREIGK